MPTATLESNGSSPKPAPESRATDPLDRIWDEIKVYHAEILKFKDMEPDQVLLAISGYAARCSEIRAHLSRSTNRAATSFKANIVEPCLADLDFQFRIHSRILSFHQFDYKMAGGQT